MRARARPESLRYLSTSSLHELRQQTAIKKKKEKRKKKKEKRKKKKVPRRRT
jgi:hypothetical protein